MILLNGQTLQTKDRFRVESMQLNLEERNSSATITVGPDAPEISINDWLKDDTEPGKGIVWRVKSLRDNKNTNTRTITLEHVIQHLKDCLLFGDIQPKDITGNNSASVCTARQAITYVLGRQAQRIWQLGDLCENPGNPYNFNGDSLFAALETITGSIDGAQWEYDLGALPFTLHIRRAPEGFQSEMRMRRNITDLQIQIDKTRMYTRHYPIGKNNLHIDGNYLSQNESIWGVVEKVETDQSLDTKEKLTAWSLERLKRHCEPLITVTITGLDLSEDTGEPLDHIVVGRTCRLPLPEYSTTVTEKVTKLSWSDKIKEPQKVTVTLANLMEDVASIINSQASRTGKSSRTGAKQSEEDHAWFVDTTDHVAMVAEAVAGPGADKDWSRVSEIVADGEGIHQRVTKTEDGLVTATAAIEVNENAITQEVTRANAAEGYLSGRISVTAEAINQEVTRATAAEGTLSGRITVTAEAINQEVTRATAAEGTLGGRITTEAGKISLVVEEKEGQNVIKAASIVTAVNDAGSSVAIAADHVSISGNTKLSGALTIEDGNLLVKKTAVFQGNLTLQTAGSYIQAPNLNVASGGHLRLIGSQSGEYYDLTAASIQNYIKNAEVDGNTLKLWKVTDSINPSITFSKATTLSGAWSGDDYVVTASPQGNRFIVPMPLRLNGTTAASNFSAEITDAAGQTAKKYVYGYLLLTVDGTNSYVDVNTKSDGTGTAVARTYVGDVFNAAKVSTSWNNNAFSYARSATGVTSGSFTVTSRFGSGNGQYYIETAKAEGGSTTGITGSSVTYQLAMAGTTTGTTVQVQDTSGNRIADTPELSVGSLYTDGYNSAKIAGSWSNNTFSYSKGTTGVNSGSFTISSRFGSGNGQYYIESAKAEGGSTTGITGSSVTYQLAMAGTTTGTTVQVQDTSGNRIADTPELSVGSLYTDGYNSARISGSWTNNVFSYSKSASGVTSGSFAVAPRFGVSSGTYYVEVAKTEGGSTAGISGSSTTIKLGRSSNTIQVQDAGGSRIADTPTYALTSHTNCVAGLTRAKVNNNLIHDKLYYRDGSVYKEVTGEAQYWYYKSANSDLTTYYS